MPPDTESEGPAPECLNSNHGGWTYGQGSEYD